MKIQRKISYLADSRFNKVPFIRLSGKWLQNLGFEVGRNFIIKIERDKLIIETTNKEDIKDDKHINI